MTFPKYFLSHLLVLLSGFIFPFTSEAQLNRGGSPWSFTPGSAPSHSIDVVIAPPDLDVVAEEDLEHPVPYRFAVNLPVDAGINDRAGRWTALPSGDSVWLLTLKSPGAHAITLYFDRYRLPEGGRLFIYNSDKSVLLGAFTDLNNNPADLFATALIPGDQVTIEYNHPAFSTALPLLHLSEVAYAYRGVQEPSRRGFGSSGPCEVNTMCPEGNSWHDPMKGIARVGVKKYGSTFWCSGSLVNNTRQDHTPYFLTADHCGQGATPQDIGQWIFYFAYQSPTCENPATEPGFRSLNGASVKSASGDVNFDGSDFLLLLLNQTIPDTFDVWFNGWNRVDIPSTSGVGIHHPQGDIRKISTYDTPLNSSTWSGHTAGTHWEVVWAATVSGHGVTEGGSSGSPLFDPSGWIVGALTGGESKCDSGSLDKPDYYGKFSYSWNSNGADSTHRLDYWLDPDSTGVLSLDGIPLNIPQPEQHPAELTLFPNPVSGILNIKSDLFLNQPRIAISLIDSWGRTVRTIPEAGNGTHRLTVDMTTLPNGFYLIRISLDGKAMTGRFIKLN